MIFTVQLIAARDHMYIHSSDLVAGRLAAESAIPLIDIIHLHGYLIYYIILYHITAFFF